MSFEDEFLNDFANHENDEILESGSSEGEVSESDEGFEKNASDVGHSNEPKKPLAFDGHFLGLLNTVSSFSVSMGKPDVESLLAECNLALAKISMETAVWHRIACANYQNFFPELEKLVTDPKEYAQVICAYGYSDSPSQTVLTSILPSATVMVVKVSKSAHANTIANRSAENTTEALDRAIKASNEILQLENHRSTLLTFVEAQIQNVAPNLYDLLGSRTAALLIGIAGGLQKLSTIPSNDIQVLGKKKKNDNALVHGDNQIFYRHAGVLGQAPLVTSCPPDLRRRLLRVLAGRVGLAARVDHEGRDRTSGRKWLAEIQAKLTSWQDPGPGKTKKALPVPDEQRPKRRGGRRARKLKEKLGATSMAKLANREVFGDGAEGSTEYSVSAMGEDLGMLTKSAYTGRVRQVQVKDTQKLSKKLKGINTGGSFSSGFSSLAFTPVQGMELVANPAQSNSHSGDTSTVKKRPAVPLFSRS